jgi:hypothetical protein
MHVASLFLIVIYSTGKVFFIIFIHTNRKENIVHMNLQDRRQEEYLDGCRLKDTIMASKVCTQRKVGKRKVC